MNRLAVDLEHWHGGSGVRFGSGVGFGGSWSLKWR